MKAEEVQKFFDKVRPKITLQDSIDLTYLISDYQAEITKLKREIKELREENKKQKNDFFKELEDITYQPDKWHRSLIEELMNELREGDKS